MNKTKIEWCDYTINPVKGLCPMACPYCYARKMYNNPYYAALYNHREIQWAPYALNDVATIRKPSRIFVGSTMELFGDWIETAWLNTIFRAIESYPQHAFIFLTKQPQNLARWSPFPENCWVGVSATSKAMFSRAIFELVDIRASVKFVSIEPLLDWKINDSLDKQISTINWIIIGSQTQPVRHPPKEWVDEIISAADKAGIPVFVKEPMASHYNIHRQEFPREVERR